MHRTRIVVAALLIGFVVAALPVGATPGAVVVARGSMYLPGGFQNTGPVVMPQGAEVDFVNGDLIPAHTFTATAVQADGETPLFDSGVVDPSDSVLVDTSTLAPGDYVFYCTVHGYLNLHGTLRIL